MLIDDIIRARPQPPLQEPGRSTLSAILRQAERFTLALLTDMERWRGEPTENQLNWIEALYGRFQAATGP